MDEQIAALQAQIDALRAQQLPTRGPLTVREVARRLRISRQHTLGPALRRGEIRTLPYGKRHRVPYDEFERLMREGVGEQRKRRRPAPVREKAVHAPPPDISADLARLKSTTLKDSLAAARARRDAQRK